MKKIDFVGILVGLYIVGFIVSFGHISARWTRQAEEKEVACRAAGRTDCRFYSDAGFAPFASLFWPLYVSYIVWEGHA